MDDVIVEDVGHDVIVTTPRLVRGIELEDVFEPTTHVQGHHVVAVRYR